MSKWREVRLGEVVDINVKNTSKDYNGKISYVDISSVGNGILKNYKEYEYKEAPSRARRVVRDEDIIYSTVRPNLKAFYKFKRNIPKNIIASTGFVVLSKTEVASIDYIYYFMITQSFINHLSQIAKGAAYPAVGVDDFKQFKIQIPDLETQEKIADVLSSYDKLIENNNKRIEILEKSAEEIYKEWFVRMRFPGYKDTKFDKGIPEGWEVKKVGDLVNVTSSKRVYSSDYVESGIPFYRSKEVIQLSKGEAISGVLYISEEKYLEFKEKFGVPIKNDILLSSVGTIGVPMLIKDENPFYFKDGNLTWIQSNLNAELSLYLYLWLKSDIGKQQLLASTIGTSQRALTIEKIKKIKIVNPKKDILSDFNKIINNVQQSINNLLKQNQNLIKQRDLLLPRLMNGTIEVN